MNRRFLYSISSLLTALVCLSALATDSKPRESDWIGSWYNSPVEFSPELRNVTLRTVVHLTIGGNRLRLRLTNLYGRTPLVVRSTYVSASGVTKQVTFGGESGTTIPPGAAASSDPVAILTTAASDLAISVFYPNSAPRELTMHFSDGSTTVSRGDTTNHSTGSGADISPTIATYFLAAVDVENTHAKGTIVALGDSITDGSIDHWPALLANRLAKSGNSYGVLNAGISGNRLLYDAGGFTGMYGQSAIRRFNREVLAQPGVRYVIVYEGINDIGLGGTSRADGSSPPSLPDVIHALLELTRQAHKHNVKIFLATLTPFEGTSIRSYYSPEKSELRRTINAWIRTSTDVDGYFDFDKALADPAAPNKLNSNFDSGDHLHPNSAGERALSEAVDITCFS